MDNWTFNMINGFIDDLFNFNKLKSVLLSRASYLLAIDRSDMLKFVKKSNNYEIKMIKKIRRW